MSTGCNKKNIPKGGSCTPLDNCQDGQTTCDSDGHPSCSQCDGNYELATNGICIKISLVNVNVIPDHANTVFRRIQATKSTDKIELKATLDNPPFAVHDERPANIIVMALTFDVTDIDFENNTTGDLTLKIPAANFDEETAKTAAAGPNETPTLYSNTNGFRYPIVPLHAAILSGEQSNTLDDAITSKTGYDAVNIHAQFPNYG